MAVNNKTVKKIAFFMKPKQSDMEERKPCDTTLCKYVCTGYRGTYEALGKAVTKFWVDAGHIRFSFGGYRWQADTPKRIKDDLIALDTWDQLSDEEKLLIPAPNDMRQTKVTALRGNKIIKTSSEQLRKMRERRADRIKRGEPDKKRSKRTLHDRVVGYA
jgi:hypothetical protein